MKTLSLNNKFCGVAPLIPLIFAGISAATSIGQTVSGAVQNGNANKLLPSTEDPNQIAFLTDLERKRNSFSTGSAFSALEKKIGQNTSSLKSGIIGAGSGDSSSVLMALARATEGAGNSVNSGLGEMENRRFAYDQLYNEVLGKTVSRKLGLGMQNYQQQKTEGTSLTAAGVDNTMASLANVLKFDLKGLTNKSGDKNTTKTSNPPTPPPVITGNDKNPVVQPGTYTNGIKSELPQELQLPTSTYWKSFAGGENIIF